MDQNKKSNKETCLKVLTSLFAMNQEQQQKFLKYQELLKTENEKYNLTAIVDDQAIMLDHFVDSLALLSLYDMQKVTSIIDVGSGAGFPGMPLAIMLPDVSFCLVEVNLKKVHFLNLVISQLQLQNVTVSTLDWRTLLRSTDHVANMVIARASLQVEELLRMFKPSSALKAATLVYWASKKWIPTEQEKEYLVLQREYSVGQKQRMLCFFEHQ